jgi:hypothetical protein
MIPSIINIINNAKKNFKLIQGPRIHQTGNHTKTVINLNLIIKSVLNFTK